MSTLTIRNIDEGLKGRLRMRAALNGRSMEAEVRAILREMLLDADPPERGLGSRIHERFAGLGGDELALPARDEPPRAPDLAG